MKAYGPGIVGVPASVPSGARVRPVGRVPSIRVHERGLVPPVAARAWVYGVVTKPSGNKRGVVMASGKVIVSVNACAAVCGVGRVASVAVTVKVKSPLVVGVPVMLPSGKRDRPAGRAAEVIDQT